MIPGTLPCPKCRSEQPIKDAKERPMDKGRYSVRAVCIKCGSQLMKIFTPPKPSKKEEPK